MTSFYDRHVMPRLIGCACAARPIMKQRAKVVPLAEGRVLELGIGGGCHLTRPIGSAIAGAGFSLERVESMYLPKTPRPLGWNDWGVAARA